MICGKWDDVRYDGGGERISCGLVLVEEEVGGVSETVTDFERVARPMVVRRGSDGSIS